MTDLALCGGRSLWYVALAPTTYCVLVAHHRRGQMASLSGPVVSRTDLSSTMNLLVLTCLHARTWRVCSSFEGRTSEHGDSDSHKNWPAKTDSRV